MRSFTALGRAHKRSISGKLNEQNQINMLILHSVADLDPFGFETLHGLVGRIQNRIRTCDHLPSIDFASTNENPRHQFFVYFTQ
jgi:hypothetical protein